MSWAYINPRRIATPLEYLSSNIPFRISWVAAYYLSCKVEEHNLQLSLNYPNVASAQGYQPRKPAPFRLTFYHSRTGHIRMNVSLLPYLPIAGYFNPVSKRQ